MSNKTQIQITQIDCTSTSEISSDEVYLICQADGGIPAGYPFGIAKLKSNPHSMSAGDTWKLCDSDGNYNLVLNFEHEVLVTLWDSDVDDDLTVSTYLVSYDYTPGNIPSQISIQNPNGANYTIYAQLYTDTDS